MNIFFQISLLIIVWSNVQTEIIKRCKTPKETIGRCIPIQECTYAMENVNIIKEYKIKNGVMPAELSDSLLQAKCEGSTEEIHICCDYVENLNRIQAWSTLSAQKCGESAGGRIAFGENANLNEFPWLALLRYDIPEERQFLCSGSLISARYILTAAHCIKPNLIDIRLGEHDLATVTDCQRRGPHLRCAPPAEDFDIEKIVMHPKYTRDSYKYDAALIRLARDVVFNVHIKPVCLPITEQSIQLPDDMKYLIAGWGRMQNESVANILQKAVLPYVNRQECDAKWRTNLDDIVLCAGGINADSCKGDSGGPLFYMVPYKSELPRYIQYGITAAGIAKCGPSDAYPTIYTDVVKILTWLLQNMQ